MRDKVITCLRHIDDRAVSDHGLMTGFSSPVTLRHNITGCGLLESGWKGNRTGGSWTRSSRGTSPCDGRSPTWRCLRSVFITETYKYGTRRMRNCSKASAEVDARPYTGLQHGVGPGDGRAEPWCTGLQHSAGSGGRLRWALMASLAIAQHQVYSC